MTAKWPVVRLGDVLTQVSEPHQVQADQEYPNFGMFSFGRGLFHKQPISGATTSATTLYRVRKGQFIYSRLFAFEGAYGVVTDPFDAHYVSNEYPVFETNPSRLLPEFLAAYLRLPAAWEAVAKRATGMGDRRRRVQPEQFVRHEISLPTVAEQRQILLKVDTLAAQIHEVRGHRLDSGAEAEILFRQASDRVFRKLKADRKPIAELFELVNGRAFKPEEWQETGRRIVRIQNLKYQDAAYNHYTGPVDPKHLVHNGDVLFAWSGQVVSLGAHIWQFDEAILNQHIFNVRGKVEFLPSFVRAGLNALVDEMKEQVRGLEMFHIRKRELDRLLFPCPSLPEQRSIVAELDALQTQVDALKQLQSEATTEIDALLPAVLDRAFNGTL